MAEAMDYIEGLGGLEGWTILNSSLDAHVVVASVEILQSLKSEN
jgi:hypothetical protein